MAPGTSVISPGLSEELKPKDRNFLSELNTGVFFVQEVIMVSEINQKCRMCFIYAFSYIKVRSCFEL
jgi:hypothetical protein